MNGQPASAPTETEPLYAGWPTSHHAMSKLLVFKVKELSWDEIITEFVADDETGLLG